MITFVNKFTLTGEASEFELHFEMVAEFMFRQDGFVRHSFLRSIHDPCIYINIAEWESASALRAVIETPEFELCAAPLRELAQSVPAIYEAISENEG